MTAHDVCDDGGIGTVDLYPRRNFFLIVHSRGLTYKVIFLTGFSFLNSQVADTIWHMANVVYDAWAKYWNGPAVEQ